MLKKLWLALLLCCLTVTAAYGEGTLAERAQQAELAEAIQVTAMPLEDFLALLSREAGITILPTPATAGIKIDLQLPAGQKLGQVMDMLRAKYSLMFTTKADGNAIIVMAPAYQDYYLANTKMLGYGDAPARPAHAAFALPPASARPAVGQYNTEEYNRLYDDSFHDALTTPRSTFGIDVDTASYSNLRRYINSGQLPPSDAVRTEEMLNYFRYDYPQPGAGQPFSVTTEVGACPWDPAHRLVLIGLQGRNIGMEAVPAGNLVFLIDVSGSMNAPNRLPLVKTAFQMLISQLRPQDKVSIVVYAGRAGMVLEPTSGAEKEKITKALDSLEAGGSTAGGEGIRLAYDIAKTNFIAGGNNRVILATDGDFNVGVSSEGELTRLIEEKRADGIYLSVLGFGMGNIKDNKMEALADKGNGNYAYIDSASEAKKLMVEQLAGTLYTIAKDVKLQVEFNPAKVASYRLIGYENRKLADSDFNNDAKDAGDMGAGHSVTALYEIVPDGTEQALTDGLVYQRPELVASDDLLQIKIRYKKPGADVSTLLTERVANPTGYGMPSENFRFAAAVAEYAMLLRSSEYKGRSNYRQVLELAQSGLGKDEDGYRAEFVRLVKVSQYLR